MDLKITSLYENNMIYPMTRSNIGTPVEKIAPVSKTEIEKSAKIRPESITFAYYTADGTEIYSVTE